jgi:hypothetical protein
LECTREHGKREVVQVIGESVGACTVVQPNNRRDTTGLILIILMMKVSTLRMVHAKPGLPAWTVKKRSSLAKCTRVKYLFGILVARGVVKTLVETMTLGTD